MIEVALRKPLAGANGTMELSVAFTLKKGDFLAISGPSGSGKTTLLRILAGLETAEGTILVEGQRWLDETRALPPQRRSLGFVFQDYALFANMRVKENLLFVRRDEKLAGELLELAGLSRLADRYPAQLSGGQQQRVALCRALMKRPRLLLMDEPFSALDPAMRRRLQETVRTLHDRFGTTTILVSHDPVEIYRLADRVLMMEEGKVRRDGSPLELFLDPSGSRKFAFYGEILEIRRKDAIHLAVVAVGRQIVEVVLQREDARRLRPGDRVRIGTKAFAPMLEPL